MAMRILKHWRIWRKWISVSEPVTGKSLHLGHKDEFRWPEKAGRQGNLIAYLRNQADQPAAL